MIFAILYFTCSSHFLSNFVGSFITQLNRSSRPSNTLQQENPIRPAITPRRALALRIHGHRRGFIRCIPAHVATTWCSNNVSSTTNTMNRELYSTLRYQMCIQCGEFKTKDRVLNIPQMAYNYSTFDQTKTQILIYLA